MYKNADNIRFENKGFRHHYNIMYNCSKSLDYKIKQEGFCLKKTFLLLSDTSVLSKETGSRVLLFGIYGHKNNG